MGHIGFCSSGLAGLGGFEGLRLGKKDAGDYSKVPLHEDLQGLQCTGRKRFAAHQACFFVRSGLLGKSAPLASSTSSLREYGALRT